MRALKRFGLILAGLALASLLGEGGLRAVEQRRERRARLSVSDPALEMRVPGGAPGHDERGFRNEAVPSRVELVALGDSQTWGANVTREQAWPYRLARLSGRTVYNMGQGGYGPLQYHLLTPHAIALSPTQIVIALYLGNDIYDAYRTAYSLALHQQFRSARARPGLEKDTIAERSRALLESERRHSNAFGARQPRLWPLWLRGHSAVGRLLDASLVEAGLAPGAWHLAERSWALAYPEAGAVWDGPAPTVFRTAFRLLALDLDEPRIAEGMRICQEALDRIGTDTERAGVGTLVLLLPTKETVYSDLVARRSGGLAPAYQRLTEMETRIREEIAAFLGRRGMPYLDALPTLREATEQARRVFPATTDGHLTVDGHLVIAALVNRAQQDAPRGRSR